MPQTFRYTTRYPNIFIRKLKDDVYLTYNKASKIAIINHVDRKEFHEELYESTVELEDMKACDLIYNASNWYAKYIESNELRNDFIVAYNSLDHIAANAIQHLSTVEIPEKICLLKRYIKCDPVGKYMPKCHELLDRLMFHESWNRLQRRKAHIIQTYWRRVIVDPCHPVCQSRLKHEWEDFSREII